MANRVLLGRLASSAAVDWEAVAFGVLQAAVGVNPGKTLFEDTTINGRSLGDIDNDGDVNIVDAVAFLQYSGDPSGSTQAEINYIEQVAAPYITANSSTYGNYFLGEFGLRVSKAGVDVTTAGPYDLLFDSTRAEAGLQFSAGSATVTVTSSTATGTYYSNWIYFNSDQSALNYTPVVFANRLTSSLYLKVPELQTAVDRYNNGSSIVSTSWQFHTTYMEFLDSTRFRFVIRNYYTDAGFYGLTAGTYTFKYITLTAGGSTVTAA